MTVGSHRTLPVAQSPGRILHIPHPAGHIPQSAQKWHCQVRAAFTLWGLPGLAALPQIPRCATPSHSCHCQHLTAVPPFSRITSSQIPLSGCQGVTPFSALYQRLEKRDVLALVALLALQVPKGFRHSRQLSPSTTHRPVSLPSSGWEPSRQAV